MHQTSCNHVNSPATKPRYPIHHPDLSGRGQNSFMGVQRSYYHLREAQNFAQLSRFVGSTTVTMMLSPNTPSIIIDAPKDDQFLQTRRDQFYCKDSGLLDSLEARSLFSRCVGHVLPT